MKTNSNFRVATATSFFMSELIMPSYFYRKVSGFNETKAVKASRFSHLIPTCKV